MKKVNRGTIIDMPWWYTIWQRSGYNPTHVKKNFPGDPLEPDEVPGADEENKSHFTLTMPWNLASPVKISPGMIVRQHHTDQKQMGLPQEQCAE